MAGFLGREGVSAVYRIDPDSGAQRKVPNTERGGYAALSSDGRQLAFVRQGRIEDQGLSNDQVLVFLDLYVGKRDGSEVALVEEDVVSPAWSPDDERFAFVSANGDVFISDADGKDRRQLTSDEASAKSPDWSPDGKRIVYGTVEGLVVIDADGSDRQQLTQGFHSEPDWSPDGERIAFDDGLFDIYVVGVDDRKVTRLTHRRQPELAPTWSPDGRFIAFLSTASNCSPCGANWPKQVWVMKADGSGAYAVTHGGDYDVPSWGPR